MIWLAKRYYWGFDGVDPSIEQARYWFEEAAARNNAEGLYNVGVFYSNGQAGYEKNYAKALEYFNASASQLEPFPMALHAMGNHFLLNGQTEYDTRLARWYFERAAIMGSAEGFYSLGTMTREGIGGDIDLPLAVDYFAKATSLGNIRAANYLAHALWDSESWLGNYARTRVNKIDGDSNESKGPVQIYLPGAIKVSLPKNLDICPHCALVLFKYIAEHSAGINDASEEGLEAYLSGDLWAALDFYDEVNVKKGRKKERKREREKERERERNSNAESIKLF